MLGGRREAQGRAQILVSYNLVLRVFRGEKIDEIAEMERMDPAYIEGIYDQLIKVLADPYQFL